MSKSKVLALAGAAGLIAPGAASAQGVLDAHIFTNDTAAYCYDVGSIFYGGTYDSNSVNSSGNDWSDTRFSAFSGLGFDGSGKGTNNTGFNPSNPGISNNFSKVYYNLQADASINQTGAYYEGAYAAQYDYVFFTVNSSTSWSLDADVTGTTTQGYYNLANFDFNLYTSTWSWIGGGSMSSYNGSGDYNQHVSFGGTIGPGSYIAVVSTYAQMDNYIWGGQYTGSSSVVVSNGVFAIPAPGAAALVGLGGLTAMRRRR